MYYCENCCAAAEESRCPVCKRRHLRPARWEDYCYLATRDKLWSEPLKDYLTHSGIPFVAQRCGGKSLSFYGIAGAEQEKLFVRWGDLAKARELLEALESEEVTILPEDGENWEEPE